MYLSIDLSAFEQIKLKLFDKKTVASRAFCRVNRDLLKSIASFLKENKVKTQSVKGLVAVMGGGSFTSARISAVVANAFGYALDIPLLKISEADLSDLPQLVERIDSQPRGQYITASYSGEPHIGK